MSPTKPPTSTDPPSEPEALYGSAEGTIQEYLALCAHFPTLKDTRGGVKIEYITGEQAITRLNQTFGLRGWSFTIREHGINAEADEAWVLGEIALSDGTIRQQFGSQKLKRARASGIILDIGFDLKGAATDALKKCATLLGVALYLSQKEEQHPREAGGPGEPQTAPARAPAGQGPKTQPEHRPQSPPAGREGPVPPNGAPRDTPGPVGQPGGPPASGAPGATGSNGDKTGWALVTHLVAQLKDLSTSTEMQAFEEHVTARADAGALDDKQVAEIARQVAKRAESITR